jgi:demethylmenaquinone methyltransferase/2-methoxy-6-polyprenyl-1,4-benzoquinol methylase
MARAHLDKRPGDVAAMFDAIAGRYDLLNDVLSAGQVRLWRRAVARIAAAGLSERVLDLAAGTGTSSLTFTAAGADCVACDFSLGMLRAGRSRLAGQRDVQRRDGRGRLGFVAGARRRPRSSGCGTWPAPARPWPRCAG